MVFIRRTFFFTLIFALVFVVAVVTAPLYLPGLLSKLLEEQGVTVSEIQLRFPSATTWVIPEVKAHSELGMDIRAETLVLHFRLTQLVRGQLEAIDINHLSITTTENPVEIQSEAAKSELEQFPAISQWVDALPFNRLAIANGEIDARLIIDNVDLQRDEIGITLSGLLLQDDQEIHLQGQLINEDSFDLSLRTESGFVALEGSYNSDLISGRGEINVDVALLKPWLPEELADLQGTLENSLEFSLKNEESIVLDSSSKLVGQLTLLDYFDSFHIDQSLKVIGSLQSPTVILVKGDVVQINNLQQPIEQKNITVALTSDLELKDIAHGVNVEQRAALQFRTDRDSVDIVFNGKRVSVNGHIPSVTPDFYLSSEMEVDSFSPLKLRILSGGQISLGRIGSFGNTIANVKEDVIVVQNNDGLRFQEDLLLDILSPKLQATLRSEGALSPTDLKTTVQTDNLIIEETSIGSVEIVVLSNFNENVDIVLDGNVNGLPLSGVASLNPETLRGEFQIEMKDLTPLSNYLAEQCMEVSRGSALLKGSMALSSPGGFSGDFSLLDFGIEMPTSNIDGINAQVGWRYQLGGDSPGLRAQAGFALTAGKVNLPSVDIGMLIRDLEAQMRYSDQNLLVERVRAKTLGGELRGDNLNWRFDQPQNRLRLSIDNADLRELVALENYEGLEVSGRVNITLPMLINSASIQVVGGKIESTGSGGEIHLPVDGSNRTGPEKDAFDALKNFHFESLSGGIDGPLALDPTGYLISNLTLRGANPDMGRPVSMNLSIEQNTYPIFQTLALFDKINRIGQCPQ